MPSYILDQMRLREEKKNIKKKDTDRIKLEEEQKRSWLFYQPIF